MYNEKNFIENNLSDIVVCYNSECRRVYVNTQWEKINNLPANVAMDKTPIEESGILKYDVENYQRRLEQAIELGLEDEWDMEIEINSKAYIYSIRAIPQYGNLGKINCLLVTASDITKRKQKEEKKLNHQMSLFFEKELIGMSIITPQKTWKRANNKLCSIIGYSFEELKNLTWQDITHPDDLEKSLDLFEKMLSGKFGEYSIEKRFIHKNKSIVYVKMSVSCVKNESNVIDYILVLTENITDYMQTKNTLEDLNSILEKRNENHIIEYRDMITNLNLEVIEGKEKEKIIKNKELEFFSLLEHLPDNIVRFDLEGRYLYINPIHEQTLDLSQSEVLGKRIHDLFPEHDKVIEAIDNIRLNKLDKVIHISQEVLVNGKIEIHDIKLIAEKDENNDITTILGIGRDISKLLNTQKELERSEKKFRTLVQNAKTPIYRFGKDFKRLYVNPEVEKLVGKGYEELVGKTPFEVKLIDDDSIYKLQEALDIVYKTKQSTYVELKFILADKTTKYFMHNLIPEFDKNGNVESILAISFDLSAQKELAKKEEEFRTLTENSLDVIVRYDCDLRRVYVNPAYEHVNNTTANEALGKSPSEKSWAISGIVSRYEEQLRRVIETKKSINIEFSFEDKNGETIYYSQNIIPEFNSDGEVSTILTIAHDITESKVMEKQLLEKNLFLDSLLNAIPVPVFYKDKETRYQGFNKAFEEFYGKKKEELIGKEVFDLFPREQAQIYFDADVQIFQNNKTQVYETKLQDVRGVDYDVMFHKSVYLDNEGSVSGLIGTILDITELKAQENVLVSKEKEFRTLAENSPNIIMRYNKKCERVYANQTFSKQTGIPQELIVNNKLETQWATYLDMLTITAKEYQNKLKRVLKTGEDDKFPIEWIKKSDNLRVVFDLHMLAERDSNGDIIAVLVIGHDITEKKAYEKEILEREKEFRTLSEHTPDTIARYDKNCIRTYINPAFCKIAGKTKEELLGKKPTFYSTSSSLKEYEEKIKEVFKHGMEIDFELSWENVKKEIVTSLIHIVPEYDSAGKVKSVFATGRDITKLKKIEKEIHKQKDFQDVLLSGIAEAGLTVNVIEEGKYIYTNNIPMAKEFGYDENISDTRPSIFETIHPDDKEKVIQMYQKRLAGEEVPNNYTIRQINQHGETQEHEVSVVLIPNTKPIQSLVLSQDITERKNIEKRIEFMAHHDNLTKLPNRILAKDRIEQQLARAKRLKEKVAILFIDLDGFKNINDSLGHSVGDEILKLVAVRFRETLRATDIISRQGGDEFLVCLSDTTNKDEILFTSNRLLKSLEKPFNINNHILSVSASIGIALYPEHTKSYERLLQCADSAMYKAKENGKNTFCMFTQKMQHNLIGLFKMQNDLKDALKNREFILHYQPQVDIKKDEIVGVEALIRWEHPILGMIPPNNFISVAESSGLIVDIGKWVLNEACKQAATWIKEGKKVVMAVNISAIQFKTGKLLEAVKNALNTSGLEARYLELELTESILISDTENVLETVKAIKELGVQLSIDDFGTGYSSLAYLKRFAVDKLKIDQSFIKEILIDKDDEVIVKTIIQMAKSFNLKSIAEGVEEKEILNLLKEFGCDEVQGYYYAKPMDNKEFENYFENRLED